MFSNIEVDDARIFFVLSLRLVDEVLWSQNIREYLKIASQAPNAAGYMISFGIPIESK